MPPPAYNSLFNNAVAFPKTMKQNFMNNIRGTNTAPATEVHGENVGAPNEGADTEANTDQNNEESDEKDSCFGIMCLCSK